MKNLVQEVRNRSTRASIGIKAERQRRRKYDEEQARLALRRITSELPKKLRQTADYGLRSDVVYQFEHFCGYQTYQSECIVNGLKEWAEKNGFLFRIQESGSFYIPNHVRLEW